MKIKEAEGLILREGLTDGLLAEYEKALRRSGSDYNRQQNCYILGYNLRERDYPGAVRLVEFAMQRYRFTFPGDRRRGYEMLAHIHRDNGRADMAKQYLLVARALLAQERRGEGEMGETLLLLQNELTLTAYQWSADLERIYLDTDPEDDLIWTLRSKSLLLAWRNTSLRSTGRMWPSWPMPVNGWSGCSSMRKRPKLIACGSGIRWILPSC